MWDSILSSFRLARGNFLSLLVSLSDYPVANCPLLLSHSTCWLPDKDKSIGKPAQRNRNDKLWRGTNHPTEP